MIEDPHTSATAEQSADVHDVGKYFDVNDIEYVLSSFKHVKFRIAAFQNTLKMSLPIKYGCTNITGIFGHKSD